MTNLERQPLGAGHPDLVAPGRVAAAQDDLQSPADQSETTVENGQMNVEIIPNPEQNYEGRQWGYTLVVDGGTKFPVHTGGTGPCWNIGEDSASYADPEDADTIHVCELDELIAALQALRESAAYRENVERWK